MSVIALVAYLLFATAPVSSQNPGTGGATGGVSCCVDLSTPSCAAAYAYCMNSTVVPAGSASCQMLMCSKSVSPSRSPPALRASQSSQPIRTSVPPSVPPSMQPRPSMSATATATQSPRPPQPNSQTQTPPSVVAVSPSPTAYPSNTATGTVYLLPSTSTTSTATGTGSGSRSGLASTPATPSWTASGAASGTASPSYSETATRTATASATQSPSPTPKSAVVADVPANNAGAQAQQAQPASAPSDSVIPANAIAGAAVAGCVVMAMGAGAYMLHKHRTAAQRNVIKRKTPTIQTINPTAIKRESFRTINFKDGNYVDERVGFKPIKSARSLSV